MRGSGVSALAVLAILMTVTAARADEPPPPPPEAPAATPLAVRPAHSLDLAPTESQHLGLGAKLGLAAAAGGVAFFVWKSRTKRGAAASRMAPIVTARTSVGVRSELLVVEIGGQRLLLGVTPAGMQRLAVLPGDDEESPKPALAPLEDEPADDVAEIGFPAALRAAVAPPPRTLPRRTNQGLGPNPVVPPMQSITAPAPAPRTAIEERPQKAPGRSPRGRAASAPRGSEVAAIEEQVRGLLRMGRRT